MLVQMISTCLPLRRGRGVGVGVGTLLTALFKEQLQRRVVVTSLHVFRNVSESDPDAAEAVAGAL